MSTFREIVNMVLDRGKLMNDDSYVEAEHVLFVISRLRAYLISSKYKQMKSQIPSTNFQTLTVSLEETGNDCSCDTNNMYIVRSTEKIPDLLLINNYEGMATVTPAGAFGCNSKFSMVSAARFATVGIGKWQKLTSYTAVGPDGRLYVKSADEAILDMESIQITAVFQDAEKAALLQAQAEYDECNAESAPCDVMDMEFPLEEGLVTLLIDYAANAVFDMASKPKDDKNSAEDELGNISNYLNALLKDRYKRNVAPTDE